MNGDSIEKLRTLQLTSLEDDDEDEIVSSNANKSGEDEYDDDDDDDDDEEEEEEVCVTLGFVEKPKNDWSLLRQLFPSKAGGIPAWLDPVSLPSGKSCLCDICGMPLQFLLQVYAPLNQNKSTFHRTLYVFMCPSMQCLLRDQHEQWKQLPVKASRSVKIFRCQLPHSNQFYSSEPPRHDGTDKPSGIGAALCSWCGTWKGDKVCSSCRSVRYCSEKHQVYHWRSGHKNDCRQFSISSQVPDSCSSNKSGAIPEVANTSLWPQHEIINEDESEYIDLDMSDTNGYAKSMVSESRVDESMKSLLDSFEGDADKKSWVSFQERISRAPEQVLRYCRNVRAKPLWPMSSGRPIKLDIPKCCYCGSPRVFEFQILPQLLYYFGVKNEVDSLDWATMVLYTCEASCEEGSTYKEEFAWIQIASQSTITPI